MYLHACNDRTRPLISIIIPCHNVARTIRATLQTVRRQLYSSIEIICVENGSTDETLDILQSAAVEEPRLRIVHSSPGPGSARMAGVAAASGDLIAFLDGDDFLEPDFLSEMQAAMDAEDADMVQCAIRYAWPDRTYLSASPEGVLAGDACKRALDMPGHTPFLKPQLWNKLYRRAVLDGVTIRDICFEDAECLPKIVERCRRIVVIPDALITYNKRFSVLTGAGFNDLQLAPKYFSSCFESQRPYLDAASRKEREVWNLPLPVCVHANLGNYLRAVDKEIAGASAAEQAVFWNELSKYIIKLREISSPREFLEITKCVSKMTNLPVSIAVELQARESIFLSAPADEHNRVAAFEAKMSELDSGIAKDPNLWVFTSWGHYNRHTIDNPRAVFEAVKHNDKIRKVVMMNAPYDEADIISEGENVSFLRLETEVGLQTLLQAGVIITGYSLHNIFGYRRLPIHPDRKILQAWHGIPIKCIGLTVASTVERHWQSEHRRYFALPSSSRLDQATMSRSFAPLSPDRVKLTGLPRHDFLSCPEQALPADYRSDLDKVRQRLDGRRLVLFAPTWRSDPKDRIELSLSELQRLDKLFAEHNAVIGFRDHRNMVRHKHRFPLSSDHVIQVGDIPDANILMRLCDALVTDYSSIYLDYMLLNRPVILYTPDIDRYRKTRGLNYAVEAILPHKIKITSFNILEHALRDILIGETAVDAAYAEVRSRFHDFEPDGQAAQRFLKEAGLLSEIEG